MLDSSGKKTLTVVTATNLNARYLSCVPDFIEFWKVFENSKSLSITPHVILVAEEIPKELMRFKGNISLLTVPDVDSSFAAQNIRTLSAGDFNTDYVITSDIDMLPLDLKILSRPLESLKTNPNSFVVIRDVLESDQYPICYCLASPEIWHSIMNSDNDSKADLRALAELVNHHETYDGVHGGKGWFTDQEILYKRVNQSNVNVLKFADAETGHRRLDRAHHSRFFSFLLLPLITLGFFTDYHIHLPVHKSRYLSKSLLKAIKLGRKLRDD